jgi:hypothetical protein
MTYNVKVTMPDGDGPSFVFTDQELFRYLVDVRADGYADRDRYEEGPYQIPATGRTTSSYASPGDTTIEWSPSE